MIGEQKPGPDGLYQFQLYDVETRLLGQKIATTNLEVVHANVDPFGAVGVVWGWHDERAFYVDADENVVPRTANALAKGLFTPLVPSPPPDGTKELVNRECDRRILDRYALGKQITIQWRGGEEAEKMRAWIESVVAASNTLNKMNPIPDDFANDRYWPPSSEEQGS